MLYPGQRKRAGEPHPKAARARPAGAKRWQNATRMVYAEGAQPQPGNSEPDYAEWTGEWIETPWKL